MIAEAILSRVPINPRITLPSAVLRRMSPEKRLELIELRDRIEGFVADSRAALVAKVRLHNEVKELLAWV